MEKIQGYAIIMLLHEKINGELHVTCILYSRKKNEGNLKPQSISITLIIWQSKQRLKAESIKKDRAAHFTHPISHFWFLMCFVLEYLILSLSNTITPEVSLPKPMLLPYNFNHFVDWDTFRLRQEEIDHWREQAKVDCSKYDEEPISNVREADGSHFNNEEVEGPESSRCQGIDWNPMG